MVIFNLVNWRFFLNHQPKVTANAIFKRIMWEYFMAMPDQNPPD